MKTPTFSAIALSATVLGCAGAARAQDLFLDGDIVRGAQQGAPGPVCVLTNEFKHLTRLCLRPTRCIGWRGWCKWTPVEPAGTCPGYKSSKLGGSEDPWTTGARDEHSAIGGGSLA